jgi:hypothetical protein
MTARIAQNGHAPPRNGGATPLPFPMSSVGR